MAASQIAVGYAPLDQVVVDVAVEIKRSALNQPERGDGGHELRQRSRLINSVARRLAEMA